MSAGQLITTMTIYTHDAEIARLRAGGEQALAETISAYNERLLRMIDIRLDPRLSGRIDSADVLQYLSILRGSVDGCEWAC